jgi:hypothetical protein
MGIRAIRVNLIQAGRIIRIEVDPVFRTMQGSCVPILIVDLEEKRVLADALPTCKKTAKRNHIEQGASTC